MPHPEHPDPVMTRCSSCGKLIPRNGGLCNSCVERKRKKWEEAIQHTRASQEHWRQIREYRDQLIADLQRTDPAAAERVEKAMEDERGVLNLILEKCDFRADKHLFGVSCDLGHGCRLNVGVVPTDKAFELQLHCQI